MDRIIVKGGIPLKGKVKISGSKNSALPILAATLLAEGNSKIENLPLLKDTETILKIFALIRCKDKIKGEFRRDKHGIGKKFLPLLTIWCV